MHNGAESGGTGCSRRDSAESILWFLKETSKSVFSGIFREKPEGENRPEKGSGKGKTGCKSCTIA